MEQQGVFDTETRLGVDKSKEDEGLKPFDPTREGIAEGDKNRDQATKMIKVLEYLKSALDKIGTASAYVPTIAGGAKQSIDRLYQAQQYLSAAMGDIRVNLIKMVDKDPTLKDLVTKGLEGSGSGAGTELTLDTKPSDEAPPMLEPEGGPMAPAMDAAAPEGDLPPVPAPASNTTTLPKETAPKKQEEALPPPPPPAKKGANESFLKRLDKAIAEDGVTKERKQTSKPKRLVWQPEKTGTAGGTDKWITRGVKGHGYGSGGKFNDH